MENNKETVSLQLLCDMQEELGKALRSLARKQIRDDLDVFYVGMAKHLNDTAEGYILLRKARSIYASKLLIRPSIEAMIKLAAVRKKPDLLYRITYTELQDDKALISPSWQRAGKDYKGEHEKALRELKQEYQARFPGCMLHESRLKLRDAATKADPADRSIERFYDTYYRIYCRFTHVACRAVTGKLKAQTDALDNEVMATCVVYGSDVVASLGGEAPNLDSLFKRLQSLGETGSAKNQRP